MIIKLSSYDDNGKYCWPITKEQWDTEKDEIYLGSRKVEIKSLEDLKPYLWCQPGIQYGGSPNRAKLVYFGHPEPWWVTRNEGVEWHNERMKEIYKKLEADNGII